MCYRERAAFSSVLIAVRESHRLSDTAYREADTHKPFLPLDVCVIRLAPLSCHLFLPAAYAPPPFNSSLL